MNKFSLGVSSLLLVSTTLFAKYEAQVGFVSWMPKLAGDIKTNNSGDTAVDLNDNLGYQGNHTNSTLWLNFKHTLPLLPDFILQQTSYSQSSSKTTNITLDGQNISGKVSSSVELNQFDIILYKENTNYSKPFDIGVNFKYLASKVSISNSTVSKNKSFTLIVPMLYLATQYEITPKRYFINANFNLTSYNSNTIVDTKVEFIYKNSFGIDTLFGYRIEKLILNDIMEENIYTSGIYIGLAYNF